MNLKKLCESSGIQMKDLADKTGLSLVYLYELNRGDKNNPSFRVVTLIADALNIDIQEFSSANNQKSA